MKMIRTRLPTSSRKRRSLAETTQLLDDEPLTRRRAVLSDRRYLRPTATTVISVTGERLRSDVAITQIVTTIGWDITPQYGPYARWIGGGEHQLRLAWRHQLAQWRDFFAVVDRQAGRDTQISAKILMTLP